MQDGHIAADAKVQRGQLILNAIKTVQAIQQVKGQIGVLSATFNDVKNLTQMMINDAKSISDLSGQEFDNIKELFDFRDALAGRGYQSALGLSQWYSDETARFRNNRGAFSLEQAMINSADPKSAVRAHQSFVFRRLHLSYMRKPEIQDLEILMDLKMARTYDRQARLSTIMFNVALLAANAKGVKKIFKKGDNDNSSDESIKILGKTINISQEGLNWLRMDVLKNVDMANEWRDKAMVKYRRMLDDMDRYNDLSLELAYARYMNNKSSEILEKYKYGADRGLKQSVASNRQSPYNEWAKPQAKTSWELTKPKGGG